MKSLPSRPAGKKAELPVIPLKDLVVFPRTVMPFFVGRKKSIQAIETAMEKHDRTILLLFQKNPGVEEPGPEDLYETGTVARIVQILKLPDGTVRVLTEGSERAVVLDFTDGSSFLRASYRIIPESTEIPPAIGAMMRTIRDAFNEYSKLNKKLSPEMIARIEKTEFPDRLVDTLCSVLPIRTEKKIQFLAMEDPFVRLEEMAVHISSEIELLGLQRKIAGKVKKRMEKNQRDYFLTEQLKEINKELGRNENEDLSGIEALKSRIDALKLPDEVKEKAELELKRLSRIAPMSPESGVLRTYLEWIADLPWNAPSQDNKDIDRAEKTLDEDHYDLKKVKERILDFIAVRQIKPSGKGPILCFVGPPGTGKTSLGRSVARALGRSFVRVSLGGVRDEAEIRGHRKTYIGALPGKILQSMKKAGTTNPVFLLDEIDKMSSDWRGDPSSALLEVLDPEQNSTFADHYLEVPYDLSGVMFIATANSSHNIPYALRDRMETIEIPGYTEFEKLAIAQRFLVPKQIVENGLEGAQVRFQDAAVLDIIRNYTMEAGVRNLERSIADILRKSARAAVQKGRLLPKPETGVAKANPANETARDSAEAVGAAENSGDGSKSASDFSAKILRDLLNDDAAADTAAESVAEAGAEATAQAGAEDGKAQDVPVDVKALSASISVKTVRKHLGPPPHQRSLPSEITQPGLAYGLAWTELGGTLMSVEVSCVTGNGELLLTGNLGDVMKESARTALSFLRAHAGDFGLESDFSKKMDIHIHVPEGAIPKDGPSAGITITAAILSSLRGVSIFPGIAMTGEITLTGRLLTIGGLKEKVLAAHRNKMKKVLVPEGNRKDIGEIPPEVSSAIEFMHADDAMTALLQLFPKSILSGPRRKRKRKSVKKTTKKS